ncbi:MAG: hypothetical protein JWP29_1815 [Rhodoferax sp.]|nr:hypothetical protein [Rhodoferax sp.]
MNTPTFRREIALLLAITGAALLAILGPRVPQVADYHTFADQRSAWGLPHALDVLSNLPFAVGGVLGLLALRRRAGEGVARRLLAGLFFVGLVMAAVCSSFYHLHPDNLRLAGDRLGMVASFAGLLGLATAERISPRAGLCVASLVLVCGPLSVVFWGISGDLLPWAVLQGGGILLVLVLACCRPAVGAWGVPLLAVILAYALAKLLELGDHQVFAITGGMVSGHSLKHVAAAFAAWPVIAVVRAGKPVHNGGLKLGQRGAAGACVI